jgi:hypothetical protein
VVCKFCPFFGFLLLFVCELCAVFVFLALLWVYVNTQNMWSCLQKYNELNTVTSFWTISKFIMATFL